MLAGPMSEVFASPLLSLEHARSQIDEFERASADYFLRKPHRIIRIPDPAYKTHELHYLRLVEPLPLRVPGVARDAINNLRSALDHLGFAAATASGKRGKNAGFPFGSNAEDALSRRIGKSRDIPARVFNAMMALRPYSGGNEDLWRLNRLANVGKHERFVRAVLRTSQIEYAFEVGGLVKDIDDNLEGDLRVAWVRREAPLHYKISLDTTVRFDAIDGIAFKKPAIEMLQDFSRAVESAISTVTNEARAMGLCV